MNRASVGRGELGSCDLTRVGLFPPNKEQRTRNHLLPCVTRTRYNLVVSNTHLIRGQTKLLRNFGLRVDGHSAETIFDGF